MFQENKNQQLSYKEKFQYPYLRNMCQGQDHQALNLNNYLNRLLRLQNSHLYSFIS